MTHEHMLAVRGRFNRYLARYRGADGAFPAMHALKRRHTAHVVADAARVMSAEGWDAPRMALGRTAALLHDIGRFSQFAEFRTFQDGLSVDHAERGCEVLSREGILDGVDEEDRRMLLDAVRLHNRLALPADLAPALAELAHLVRDADKLDIFRVFEEAVAQRQLEANPEIAWNMRMEGGVSAAVLAALDAGRSIDYRDVTTFCDFVLVQVSWLTGQLHYAESRRLARERRALETRERMVLARCDDPRLAALFARLKSGGT